MTVSKSKKKYSNVLACSIGNTLEWFDYTLYGIFATTLSKVFFPSDDSFVSSIMIYVVFALGFVSRPIGGLILGYVADIIGRKRALLVSILLMTLPTFLLGILPTYNQIGVWAPILLTVIRLCQGIAIGGDFTGSMVYLVEQSPQNQRGFFGSWSDFGSPLGVLLGLFTGIILTSSMSVDDFESYGWRIPFILSLFIGSFGAYLRMNMQETNSFVKNTKKEQMPITTIVKNYKSTTICAVAINAFGGVSFYLLLTFLHNYLKTKIDIPSSDAYLYTTMANIAMIVMIPIGGYLSDLVTRKTVMNISIIVGALASIPMFYTLQNGMIFEHVMLQVIFSGSIGSFFGGRAAFYAEAYPTKIRCSAISLAFGISHALFAGTTPLMAEYVVYKTSSVLSLCIPVIICSICALFALRTIEDRTGKELL